MIWLACMLYALAPLPGWIGYAVSQKRLKASRLTNIQLATRAIDLAKENGELSKKLTDYQRVISLLVSLQLQADAIDEEWGWLFNEIASPGSDDTN